MGLAVVGHSPKRLFRQEKSMRILTAHGLALTVLATAALVACNDETTSPASQAVTPSPSVSATGNGAPSGAHYTLNIIGVAKDKSPDF
jgi:hypothetical protein